VSNDTLHSLAQPRTHSLGADAGVGVCVVGDGCERMNHSLQHLSADAKRKDTVRLDRIADNPGRATIDDTVWLCEQLRDAWAQLDYINNELPRLRMRASSRAGGSVFR